MAMNGIENGLARSMNRNSKSPPGRPPSQLAHMQYYSIIGKTPFSCNEKTNFLFC